ncbi:helix-turn-helix domain-containing protein [Plantibacter flavus]|uniref:helix-turn-helix domain-containing protein n=1 Tax=Plantibacter flavus TaxID=150123 RepID=UPI003F16F644
MELQRDQTSLGRFLTVADTADVLNVSAHAVAALIASGELPAIRVGRSGPWRIEFPVLEAFIAGRYEEARREGLWAQAELTELSEFSGAPLLRPVAPLD